MHNAGEVGNAQLVTFIARNREVALAFEGHTSVEVAQLLDQPEGAVKSRIRNGMCRMRAPLVEAGIQGVDA
jgi:DNA-directed RNA polymerase specialized sigma24 family protein